MNKIVSLFVFPVDEKKSDKSPDFRVSAQTPTGFIEVGAGWKKETKEKKKFISIRLKEPYNGNPGFCLNETMMASDPEAGF